MVGLLFVCLVGLAVGKSGADIPRKILKQIHTWSLIERCFGETNQLEFSLGLQKATEFCKVTPPGQHGLLFPENVKHFFPERILRNQVQDDTTEILKGLVQLLTRNKRQLEEEAPDAEGEDEEVGEETEDTIIETEDTIEEAEETIEENEDSVEEVLDDLEETEDVDEEGGSAAEVEDVEGSAEENEDIDVDAVEKTDDGIEKVIDAAEESEDEVEEDNDTTEETKAEVEEGGSATEVEKVEGTAEDELSIEFDGAGTTGLLNANDSEFEDFASKLKSWQSSLSLRMSNLTCVLTKLGLLDADGRPDLERLEQFINLDSITPGGSSSSSAVEDPEFRQMMSNSYSDCQAMADSWPREALGRNWLTEKHGRNVVFFGCLKKAVVGNCGKWEVSRAMEVWFGKDGAKMERIGIPGNKFDAALISMRILYDTATPEEAFVQDFFWGKD